MVLHVLPSHVRTLSLILVAAIVATGCRPDGRDASPTSAATMAVTSTEQPASSSTAAPSASPTGQPAPTDDGVTAGEPGPSVPVEPAPAASSTPTTPPDVSETDREPFTMNLYRKGDFVAQYTFEWCVGASLQMAVNMATDESRTSRADQQDLWEMARDRSLSPFGGANPRGWTATLNELGIGPYELVSLPTYEEALEVAAEAIRSTRRPVGLVMWRGRHAWVMSGFESIGDPAIHDEFTVTGIRVLDPLYPYGDARWGPSPAPNTLLTPDELARQFKARDPRSSGPDSPSGFVLVLPVGS